jgi:hypothetical protein
MKTVSKYANFPENHCSRFISSFFQKAASAVKTVAKRHPYKWVPKSAAGVDNFRRFLHKVSKWL